MNNTILSGELGQNPTIKDAGSSQVANSFLIFTNFKGQPERMKIAAWGNQATELQKYQQGAMLILEGRYKVIEQQKEGYKEQALELNVSKIHGVNV
jgi:single-stranded DNA-binding protein